MEMEVLVLEAILTIGNSKMRRLVEEEGLRWVFSDTSQPALGEGIVVFNYENARRYVDWIHTLNSHKWKSSLTVLNEEAHSEVRLLSVAESTSSADRGKLILTLKIGSVEWSIPVVEDQLRVFADELDFLFPALPVPDSPFLRTKA